MGQKRRDDGSCDSFGKKKILSIFIFLFFALPFVWISFSFSFFPFLPSILFGSGNRETEEQL